MLCLSKRYPFKCLVVLRVCVRSSLAIDAPWKRHNTFSNYGKYLNLKALWLRQMPSQNCRPSDDSLACHNAILFLLWQIQHTQFLSAAIFRASGPLRRKRQRSRRLRSCQMNTDRSTVVTLAILAIVSILTVAAYLPGLSGPLLLDDLPQLEPLIQQARTIQQNFLAITFLAPVDQRAGPWRWPLLSPTPSHMDRISGGGNTTISCCI